MIAEISCLINNSNVVGYADLRFTNLTWCEHYIFSYEVLLLESEVYENKRLSFMCYIDNVISYM